MREDMQRREASELCVPLSARRNVGLEKLESGICN